MTKITKSEKRKKKLKAKLKASRHSLHEANKLANQSKNIFTYGKNLTRRQFDAYCYCRQPMVRFLADEVEWHSFFDNKLLGTVIRDVTDNDYGYILLGRDTRRLFRCIEVGTEFYSTPKEAREALSNKIYNNYLGKVQDIYPQYDEVDAGFELFKDKIPKEEQHNGYLILKDEPRYEAARNIISEIANSFIDNDGHFEREFQSVNFQARLWELYLHVYIHNAGLLVENNHPAPDFEVSYFGKPDYP